MTKYVIYRGCAIKGEAIRKYFLRFYAYQMNVNSLKLTPIEISITRLKNMKQAKKENMTYKRRQEMVAKLDLEIIG